jgi:hypothetical protein
MSARAHSRCRRPQTPRKNPREILVVVGLPTGGFSFPVIPNGVCGVRHSSASHGFSAMRPSSLLFVRTPHKGGRDKIVLGGHDFSRAVHRPKFQKALAPEESFRIVVTKIWAVTAAQANGSTL